MHLRSAIAGLVLTVCTVASATAQVIRGRVIDAESAAPIMGAFLTLVDADGKAAASTLTDETGSFSLRAGSGGAYVLRIERLGNRTVNTDPLTIAAQDVITREFFVSADPIRLEGIRASGERRCELPRRLGVEAQTIWDEVRKVLSIVAWAERQSGVPYQALMLQRTRDLLSLELQDQQSHLHSGYGRMAFRSVPIEDLAARGYVRRLADGTVEYFGVDAAVLVSDEFLRTHCFRVERGARGAGHVGLAFEPIRGNTAPDIAGTLWLDRQSAQLQYLEFNFTGHVHPIPVPREPFGGRVEFRRLANGAWIIDRWWLRMPQLPTSITRAPVQTGSDTGSRGDDLRAAQRRGLRIWEEGAELRYMVDSASLEPGGAILTGSVYDSTRARPLAGATVFIDPGGQAVLTDAGGNFRLTNLPAGTFAAGFLHPYADSLGLPVQLRSVVLAPGVVTEVALAIPRSFDCPADADAAAITGFVHRAATGVPIESVRVVASWRTRTAWGVGFDGEERQVGTVTDSSGRYVLCGFRPGQRVRLTASMSGDQQNTDVRIDRAGIIQRDIVIQ